MILFFIFVHILQKFHIKDVVFPRSLAYRYQDCYGQNGFLNLKTSPKETERRSDVRGVTANTHELRLRRCRTTESTGDISYGGGVFRNTEPRDGVGQTGKTPGINPLCCCSTSSRLRRRETDIPMLRFEVLAWSWQDSTAPRPFAPSALSLIKPHDNLNADFPA